MILVIVAAEKNTRSVIIQIEMKKLLIATRNSGKIPGIMAELSGVPFEIVGLNTDYEVPENAMTFEGNAITKAIIFGNKTGLFTLADDSGLCVDALNGRPGVLSARYAAGSAKDKYLKLLEELREVPKEKRTARYVAVIAVYDPELETINTFEGVCEGFITTEPVGENGFGYDPIFFSPEFNKSYAQISPEEKNSISHRGKAMRKVRDYLINLKSSTSNLG